MTTLIPKYDQGGTGAVNRAINEKLAETISVLDYGADPTGVTDSTAAFTACLAAVSNIGVAGGGVRILFPKGTYLGNFAINGTLNNSLGEYGICLSGYGATLKGRVSDTSIITLNSAVANVADPLPGGSIYTNGLRIEGFTLNMTNMSASAANYAIAGQHAYNSSLCDIHVIGEPNLGGGLFLGSQCYTWVISNLNCTRVKIAGYNTSTNLNSAMSFIGLVAGQVVLTNVFAMSFTGGALQGSQDHFVMTNAQAVTVTGMDLEGPNTGEHVYNFVSTCRYITSIGNSPSGYTTTSYSTGYAPNSYLLDRPNIAGISAIGTYGKAASQGVVSVSTTSATTLYNFLDVPSGQQCALFMVAGDNGSNGFQDLIMVFTTVVTVINSSNTYGTAPTRTYTSASNTLKVALSSVSDGAYQVRPVALEFLFSSI